MFNYLLKSDVAQSDAPYVVNTVNCAGTMGKGVALSISKRHPEIVPRYKEMCKAKVLRPGSIALARAKSGQLILNMATKDHYWSPSKSDWVGSGLFYLTQILINEEPGRIALPPPGAGNGGLRPAAVQQMARIYLAPLIAKGFSVDWYGPETDPIEYPDFFAGVGARDTPPEQLARMSQISAILRDRGWFLRSGGAIGADTAFENGIGPQVGDEIYLAKQRRENPGILDVRETHFRFVKNFHEKPSALSEYATKLMARNGCQIFGADFTNPSAAVICWTPGGLEKGGTRMAIRLANRAGIPVLNLGDPALENVDVETIADMAGEALTARRKLIGLSEHPEPEEMDGRDFGGCLA